MSISYILAQGGRGALLVDVFGSPTQGASGVIDILRAAGQGEFKLVADRAYTNVDDAQSFRKTSSSKRTGHS